jgi:hypothetical protein
VASVPIGETKQAEENERKQELEEEPEKNIE